MRSQFFLFQSHLDLAFHYWSQLIVAADIVIDATCGNGQDTLKLAMLTLKEPEGKLFAFDILPDAIKETEHKLQGELSPTHYAQVHIEQRCHSTFPREIPPGSVKLIVYNLGYLPGGNKNLTTQTETTLLSLQAAEKLLVPGGAISLTCYPGHQEGQREVDAILSYCATLSPREWSICHHVWLNRKQAPSLLILQKAMSNDCRTETK